MCENLRMAWLKSSWDMVKASTISKCFRECGFKHRPDSADQDAESDMQILHDLQPEEHFESVLGEMSLDAYAAIDCGHNGGDVITTSMPDESMMLETASVRKRLRY